MFKKTADLVEVATPNNDDDDDNDYDTDDDYDNGVSARWWKYSEKLHRQLPV